MLPSYYEIAQNGRSYFGNVSLKEFHLFSHEGELYLLNVESMTPHRISADAARVVTGVAASFGGALIDERSMATLRALDLVAGGDALFAAASADPTAPTEPKKAADLMPRITNIALFVAQQCNMACVYCYGQGGEYAEKGMMSEATALKAVDWLMENSGDADKVNIGFFGGEPMMNFPLIEKVVKYAKREAGQRGKTVTFGMTTNASLLTDKRIAFLKQEGINPMVSFDGPAALQDRQRPFTNGKGSHAKVFANIQKLRAALPNVVGRATLYGDADPAEVRAGLEEAGFNSFSILKAAPVILDGAAPAGGAEAGQANARTLALEKGLTDDLVRAVKARAPVEGAGNSKVGFFIWKLISPEKRRYYCGVGRGMAAVTTAGDIYPCHRFAGQEDMKLGNIESYRIDGVNEYHRAVVDNLPECRSCWARYACGGGCFYEGKAARGDWHLPDRDSCAETKALMEMAIALYLQLDEADKAYIQQSLRKHLEETIP